MQRHPIVKIFKPVDLNPHLIKPAPARVSQFNFLSKLAKPTIGRRRNIARSVKVVADKIRRGEI